MLLDYPPALIPPSFLHSIARYICNHRGRRVSHIETITPFKSQIILSKSLSNRYQNVIDNAPAPCNYSVTRQTQQADARQEHQMKYQTRQTETGKWQAVISNPSFNLEKVYTYDTKEGADLRLQIEMQEAEDYLSTVTKLSDYFKPQN